MRGRHWIGFAHLSVVNALDSQIVGWSGWSGWYALVELRLGIVDALPDTPFPVRHDASAFAAAAPGSGIGDGL